MNLRSIILLFFGLMLFTTSSAFAFVPPDYKELTRASMKAWGFRFKIDQIEGRSSIDLRFPKKVSGERFALVPHSSDIVVMNSAGEVIAGATNWVADSEFKSIRSAYNPAVSDLSVSLTYACARKAKRGCYGATTFSIPSVSTFIRANPDLVNLQPTCRNVTSTLVDCTKYENTEHP